MVKRHVSVAAVQARQKRREQSEKGIERIPSEGAEQQVEPYDVGLQLVDDAKQVHGACGIVKRPAAIDGKTLQFGHGRRDFIGENGQAQERIAAQLLRDVQPILAETSLTGWEGRHQTNFH